MAPHATGGVIQSQQSGGQLLGSAGASSDVLSSSSSDASLDGRLELGKHFDLGLGGAYGAGGLPKTWAGRLSPRWYLTGMHARSAVALELGVSAGQYPGGPVDFSTMPKAYRVNFHSVDAPSRFGAALSADWEVFYSIGPYLSFAGRDACRTNGTSRFACQSRPYFNTGFMSDVGLQ